MVDALRSTHHALRRGGILLDVRPSGALEPRVEHDGRVIGHLGPGDLGNDEAATAAVRATIAAGLLRHERAWHFWHRFSFATRAEFDAYLGETTRFNVYRGARLPRAGITVRRAIAVDELTRL